METIGRYKILGELGRGGCGVVYRALDPTIGRTVAIKTILLGSGADPSLVERFRREARSAGILSHPNIVTIHEFSETADAMFIAMEYVEGQTLAQRMREGLMPVELTLATIRAAAAALDFAHAHNIVHRDVKPANFLINQHGSVKVADFGIAKLLDGDSGLTSTGMVIGTVQYMSPEQIAAKEVTGRSDQFSLAIITYEMLTGQRPFQGNSWASMMHAIVSTEPPPLNQHRKELGDLVTEALKKGLAKDPQDRYASCGEFAEALERSISGSTAARRAPVVLFPQPQPDETGPVAAPLHPTGVETLSMAGPSITDQVGMAPPESPAIAELPPPVGPRRWWGAPAAAGAVIVIGLAAWAMLTTSRPPDAASAPARPTGPNPLPAAASAAPPASRPAPTVPAAPASRASTPPVPKPGVQEHPEAVKAPAKEIAKIEAPIATAGPASRPANPPVPIPTPAATVPPASPPLASTPHASIAPAPQPSIAPTPPPSVAPTPPASVASTPPASVAPAAKRAEQDAASRAAADQAKLQTEKEAKAAADAKAKNARAAELQAVDQALKDYQSAYELKDAAALQTIWPLIPKSSLDEIRRSFHDATEVKMDLRPVSDPEISGNSATILCDRSLHQIISKKLLQASSRVRFVLNRRGSGWVIQSIDLVNH